MEQTLEVRWFHDGPPPNAVVDWFMGFAPETQSEREDLYLISDDPSLNVKLREGNIQLKRRSGDRSVIAFHEQVEGYQEFWQKWSFPLSDDAPNLWTDDPSGVWLPVEKSRHQRTYGPDEQRSLLGTQDNARRATALIELTTIAFGSHEAWTICMEAEGAAEALSGTLRQMGRYLFEQGTPPTLVPSQSYGYVRWLERVHQDAGVAVAIG